VIDDSEEPPEPEHRAAGRGGTPQRRFSLCPLKRALCLGMTARRPGLALAGSGLKVGTRVRPIGMRRRGGDRRRAAAGPL